MEATTILTLGVSLGWFDLAANSVFSNGHANKGIPLFGGNKSRFEHRHPGQVQCTLNH